MTDQLSGSEPIVLENRTMTKRFRDFQNQRVRDLVQHEIAALIVFTASGYGGITLEADAAQPDIDSTFKTIVGWDGVSLTNPRFITQDFANDGLRFTAQGIWQINIQATIFHNILNAGRAMQLRLFDVAAGTAIGNPVVFGTGRNVEVTNVVVSGILVDVPDTFLDDLVVLQLNSTSGTYLSVICIGGSFSATHQSEALSLLTLNLNPRYTPSGRMTLT